jgi:adenosylmethionine-8-amino-7-oxononanoate aminotransferase
MAAVDGNEVTLVSGDGSSVWDDRGRRYLDASASLWYCNVGHGRVELASAAARQMEQLAAYHIFDVFSNEPARELARRLAETSPTGPGSAVFFTSGGSESVETAGKLARRYWEVHGRPARRLLIAREGAYHGMAAFGTSLAGIAPNRTGWGPLVREVIHVDAEDPTDVARVFRDHPDEVAAFIGEPVRAAGGVYPPADGYWCEVQRLCHDHGALLIVDEVVTGFGRLGTPFGSQRFDIVPDLMCLAKGISSGYAPLGAVVSGRRVRDALWKEGVGAVRHGYTYSGHPTACAVGLANLDILEREQLYQRVERLEPVLAAAVAELADHPLVSEVRAIGLLAAVELSRGVRERVPDLTEQVTREARRKGVLVRNLLGRALQISPPYVITPEEIRHLTTTIRESLDVAARQLSAEVSSLRPA